MTGQQEVPKDWRAATEGADAELEWLLCLSSTLQASQSYKELAASRPSVLVGPIARAKLETILQPTRPGWRVSLRNLFKS